MKGLLKNKNFYKKIGLGVAILGLFGSLIGGMVGYSNYKYKDYNSTSEIANMVEEFGCDSSMLKIVENKIKTLKHNGEEPIYVTISNDYSDLERKSVVNALDHVFGVVESFNDKYKYKIVNKEFFEEKQKDKKTTIEFVIKVDEDISANAQNSFKKEFLPVFASKRIVNKSLITYFRNLSFLPNDENKGWKIERVMVHEILHSFGFDDVYNRDVLKLTDKMYGNTAVNAQHTINKMTPNDFLMLASMYAPKFTSEEEKQEYIAKVRNEFEDYAQFYIRHVAGYRNFKTTRDFNIDFEFTGKYKSLINDLVHNYKVSVKDGEYDFSIYDKDWNILDNAKGEFFVADGVGFFRNVELQKSVTPLSTTSEQYEGYISDFIIYQVGTSPILQNLYDYSVITGSVTEIENEVEK